MLEARILLSCAVILFGVGLVADFGGLRRAANALALAGVAVGVAYIARRYWLTWPMTPMFMGGVAVPPVLTGLGLLSLRFEGVPPDAPEARSVRRCVLAFALAVGILSILFPKDFYLPFLKTTSPFAHLMLIFGVLGKACLLISAAWAAAILRSPETPAAHRGLLRALVMGFACWTLALFSGEMWSYRGWGIPVVWEDPAIIASMGVWFFFVGLMHLHLTRTWPPRRRAGAMLVGAGVLLLLGCGPDLGPFRPPFAG
jgi:hypothetical protein